MTDIKYLNDLKKALRSPGTICQLFRQDTKIVYFKDFYCRRIPLSYSEPVPRASYSVEWKDGVRLFLKLNCQIQKIENELRAFKLLSHYKFQEFHVPKLFGFSLDSPCNDALSQTCGWLVEEWVAGDFVRPGDPLQLELSAKLLASINSLQIDLATISNLLNISLPNQKVIESNSRQKIIWELEKGEHLASGNIRLELRRAANIVRSNHIPFMLNLNHGDFHFRNMLVTKDKTNFYPKIIDWEDIHLEIPLYDLAHFLFLTDRRFSQSFLKTYFNYSRGLYSDYVWDEVVEIVIIMYLLWMARNIRWKAKNIENKKLKLYCDELNTNLSKLRGLPWKNLLN